VTSSLWVPAAGPPAMERVAALHRSFNTFPGQPAGSQSRQRRRRPLSWIAWAARPFRAVLPRRDEAEKMRNEVQPRAALLVRTHDMSTTTPSASMQSRVSSCIGPLVTTESSALLAKHSNACFLSPSLTRIEREQHKSSSDCDRYRSSASHEFEALLHREARLSRMFR
jgi:hypothetical protein